MKERCNVRQIPGEPRRRWFSSSDFDLIIWLSDDQQILGFELCYDKNSSQHSIAWSKHAEFRHMAVDDGEQSPGKYKSTPVLMADGYFDAKRVHSAFLESCQSLPDEVSDHVLHALELHPRFSSTSRTGKHGWVE